MDKKEYYFYNLQKALNSILEDNLILNENLLNINNRLNHFEEIIKEFVEKTTSDLSTHQTDIPTHQTDIPTNKPLFTARKDKYLPISIGNEGVPTDKQTNRQTDKQTKKNLFLEENSFQEAIGALDSLDSIKKEIRLKFKRLTEMELLVFSTIYQMEEEEISVDYRTVSGRLNLSESSIRDYVGRLIKKGIPVEKTKINNKSIQIKISSDLKRVAPLSTIIHLKDL